MVGLTDFQKIKLSIKRVLGSVWWSQKEKLESFEFVEDKATYFLEQWPDPKEAINEAYYWGRQQGRLTLAKQILSAIGEPYGEEEK